jgi:hypothetical protein
LTKVVVALCGAASLFGCAQRDGSVAGSDGIFVYDSASSCHQASHAGPRDGVKRPLIGVVATLPPGTTFKVLAEDTGKEFACLEVRSKLASGYVLWSERIIMK